MEPKTEIKVEDGKIYKVTVTIDEKGLEDLLIRRSDAYCRNYGFDYEREVTTIFAKEYVKRNFDKIAKAIDFETVKLLATRQLADVVVNNGSN